MDLSTILRIGSLAFAASITAWHAPLIAQNETAGRADLYTQIVPALELNDEDIFQSFAKLDQMGFAKFSLERLLKPKLASPLPPDPKFYARIEGETLQEVLDWLCSLDPRYAWMKGARLVHIVPRAIRDDPHCLLNRRIPIVEFKNESDGGNAALAAIRHLPGPIQQIALLQAGGSVSFAKPWTATLQDITVREAFELIAAQIGPDVGWQLTGSEDFRLMMFHHSLVPRSEYEKQRKLRMEQPPT
ncbi:MAG: hypothetical protein L0Y58_12930 [Verrucomicrobia subdivision 3 bacterium]|nr:hypothetical protein [Limisphaerales bacterium]